MNSKNRKTLEDIFSEPVSSSIKWRDLISLLKAIGGEQQEGRGSRVKFLLGGDALSLHKPHPSPNLKKYVIREVRVFLERNGVTPQ